MFYDPMKNPDCARSLRTSETVALRRSMLYEPHIVELTNFVEKLRAEYSAWEFPDFDPLDGGSDADILFLFEKPGPMTSARGKGSGFISRNNDDPTAEATFVFMEEAGLPRKHTVIWNIVPGWNGTRKVTTTELQSGIDALRSLLSLLPKLKNIVLVGQKAQRAASLVSSLGFSDFKSTHPSPLVRASQPKVWCSIPSMWSKAGSTKI